MNTTLTTHERADLDFKASQGCRASRMRYAEVLEAEGRHDWAAFMRAKAAGHPAFTLGNFEMSVASRETFLMNPYTGTIDDADGWAAEGFTPENSDLVEVRWDMETAYWVEV